MSRSVQSCTGKGDRVWLQSWIWILTEGVCMGPVTALVMCAALQTKEDEVPARGGLGDNEFPLVSRPWCFLCVNNTSERWPEGFQGTLLSHREGTLAWAQPGQPIPRKAEPVKPLVGVHMVLEDAHAQTGVCSSPAALWVPLASSAGPSSFCGWFPALGARCAREMLPYFLCAPPGCTAALSASLHFLHSETLQCSLDLWQVRAWSMAAFVQHSWAGICALCSCSQLLQRLCTSGLHEHLLFSETEQGELSPTSASEMSVLQAVIPHSRSDVWALYPSVAASFHRALGHLGLDNHQCKMLSPSKKRGSCYLK